MTGTRGEFASILVCVSFPGSPKWQRFGVHQSRVRTVRFEFRVDSFGLWSLDDFLVRTSSTSSGREAGTIVKCSFDDESFSNLFFSRSRW